MADNYRPGRSDRDRDRPPPLADRMTFGKGDTYRPGGQNRSEFTFESTHSAPRFPPSGPANSGSLPPRRNRGGPKQRAVNQPSQNNRNNAKRPRRGGYSRKAAPHERALLQYRDDGSPEHTYGVSNGPNRFMNVDEMSNDEEADMEVESDSSADDDTADGQVGKHKAVRTQALRADGDAVPKWSNPDPYTALPPPSETTGVKKDVVQLIRKAKNQAAEKAVGNNAVAANDDFISFNDDDDDGAADSTGLHIYDDDEPIRGQARSEASKRPVEGSMNDLAHVTNLSDEPRQKTYPPIESRRNHKRKFGGDVAIVSAWLAHPHSNPTPWAQSHNTYKHLTRDPEKWLHNEILDFYDFVAPQPFEHDARHRLVQRISHALANQKWFPNDAGRILCFGSYPAGLYLPTADMDLVYTSERHFGGGPPALVPASDGHAFKKTLYKASKRLQGMGIANNPVVIAKAKVPIIKFQDRLTGIDVDISFENLSGVQAQATFEKWKREYPDMIYMVALVKQLLAMRGLNEVHSGGLGGFSIICLIVSHIQHSRKADNLGECFIDFLRYYGKQFDLATQRIQMHPPAIVEKTKYGIDGRQEQLSGLSIQDPNRPDNNISGGSRKAADAFRVFAEAHDTLTDRMSASKAGHDVGPSILECIMGGNYDSYISQRRHLQALK